MRTVVVVLYLVAAIVNLAPVVGVLSAARVEALYGVPVRSPDLEILMRHRAILFSIVGALLAVAAFHAPLRSIALIAGLVSMLSFVVIAVAVGGYGPLLRRVVVIDLVATVALVLAVMLDRIAGGALDG
jgi:hypothetical protein